MCPEKCRCQRPIGACSCGSFREGKLLCPSTGLARLDHRIAAKCRLHLLLLGLCCLDRQETVFANSNYSLPEMQNIVNISEGSIAQQNFILQLGNFEKCGLLTLDLVQGSVQWHTTWHGNV